jgi:hypothetical protein
MAAGQEAGGAIALRQIALPRIAAKFNVHLHERSVGKLKKLDFSSISVRLPKCIRGFDYLRPLHSISSAPAHNRRVRRRLAAERRHPVGVPVLSFAIDA